jgi:hypothetical protein
VRNLPRLLQQLTKLVACSRRATCLIPLVLCLSLRIVVGEAGEAGVGAHEGTSFVPRHTQSHDALAIEKCRERVCTLAHERRHVIVKQATLGERVESKQRRPSLVLTEAWLCIRPLRTRRSNEVNEHLLERRRLVALVVMRRCLHPLSSARFLRRDEVQRREWRREQREGATCQAHREARTSAQSVSVADVAVVVVVAIVSRNQKNNSDRKTIAILTCSRRTSSSRARMLAARLSSSDWSVVGAAPAAEEDLLFFPCLSSSINSLNSVN